MSRYFEFKDKDSSKFWEITVSGKALMVHYGKIGTAGQIIIKELSTPAEANTHAKNVIAEKTKKGYKEKKAKKGYKEKKAKKSDREKKTKKGDREKKKSTELNAAIKLRPIRLRSTKNKLIKGWKTDVAVNSLGYRREGDGQVNYIIPNGDELPFSDENFVEDNVYDKKVNYEGDMHNDIAVLFPAPRQIGNFEFDRAISVAEILENTDEDLFEELSGQTNLLVDKEKKTITHISGAKLKAILNKTNTHIDPSDYDHIYDY